MLWNYKTSKVGDEIPSLKIDPLYLSDLILQKNLVYQMLLLMEC